MSCTLTDILGNKKLFYLTVISDISVRDTTLLERLVLVNDSGDVGNSNNNNFVFEQHKDRRIIFDRHFN